MNRKGDGTNAMCRKVPGKLSFTAFSQTGHFSLQTRQGSFILKPLYEIADETYCVYVHTSE